MASLEELKLDIAEIEKLVEQATRPKVKEFLQLQLRKVQTELINIESTQQQSSASQEVKPKPVSTGTHRPYTKDITTYGWDQSDKFMKIYVTMNGVQKLPKESVTCDFTERSFKLLVSNLEGVNYCCHVARLFEDILPSDSYFKVKTDMVLVMLKKATQSKTWAYVTEREKKASEKQKPKIDESKDPNENLMSMLKNMYDEGDDEMKRTIAKAWTESQDKKKMPMDL